MRQKTSSSKRTSSGRSLFYRNVTITFLILQKRGKPEDDQGNVKIPRLLLYALVEQAYEDRAFK